MKKILIILFILFANISFSQDWKYDFEQAKKVAVAEGKDILMVFSGSDWCAPCIRLDKNIWQSEAFIKESSEKWILVKVNFPRKKSNQLSDNQTAHNRALAEKYNNEGSFPLVVLLNSEGTIFGKMGFKNVSPDEYIKMIYALK
ncbi:MULTISPECIES: thioredoxin family protein [Flavobacterium]|uniref:Thioredoxin family protein n=1 Tax=Flavobacterium jumunjinense TaxID=998845 RepID=A0ABV5GNP4_9FLAO|nr:MULTISPECIES: thioredoxin family protein [Flavobacterium]